jgi:hypothetical protein
MSRPRAVTTRPGLSLTPMLASADDTMHCRPVSRRSARFEVSGHNHGHKNPCGGQKTRGWTPHGWYQQLAATEGMSVVPTSLEACSTEHSSTEGTVCPPPTADQLVTRRRASRSSKPLGTPRSRTSRTASGSQRQSTPSSLTTTPRLTASKQRGLRRSGRSGILFPSMDA